MKQTLLRRFRWPIFIAVFSGAHVAGLAFMYGDSHTAGVAFTVTLFAAAVAVVLNTIDEQTQEFKQ